MTKYIQTMIIAIVAFTAFAVSAPAQRADKQFYTDVNTEARTLDGSDDDGKGSLTGSWKMTVTSDTAPGPFRTLITFDSGGGVVGSAQGDILLSPPPGVAPSATAAHGAWRRTDNKKVLFTLHQIFYTADGQYAGGAKIQNSAKVNGGTMTGNLVVRYYDENDQEVFVGQGSFTASRIAAENPTP